MSQTRLPPTSHHFWLKSPCNLSSSVNSMTLLSSLTFSGPFNISYIFLHLTNNDFWPLISLILPVVLQKGACCIIQPVPRYCLLSAYLNVGTGVPVFKAKSFILGRLSVQEQADKIFTKTSEESFQSELSPHFYFYLTHTQSWILLLTSQERTTEAVFIAIALTCFGSCS